MVDVDELERRKDILQARAWKLSEKIGPCSKNAPKNSCSDLIIERNAIMNEISKINDSIDKEMKKRGKKL